MKTIDYTKNNTINLISSIMNFYGIKSNYNTLPEVDELLKRNYKHIAVCLLDGMGVEILNKTLTKNKLFHQKRLMTLSTVFPPTTVAATTSVLNGKPPIEHGWIGWHLYVEENDPSIVLFRNEDYYRNEKFTKYNVQDYLDKSLWMDHIPKDVEYNPIFPSWGINGQKNFKAALNKLKEYVNSDKKTYNYFYWTNPDSLIHVHGTTSLLVKINVNYYNKLFTKFYKNLNEDTIIFIIADHGLVDIKNICLDDYPNITSCFKKKMAGEGRFTQFYIKEDMCKYFEEEFNKTFKDDFILLTNEEFLNSHLSGLYTPHKSTNTTLGNYHAIAVKDKYLTYKCINKKFKGHHAGLTDDELNIPLIVLNK